MRKSFSTWRGEIFAVLFPVLLLLPLLHLHPAYEHAHGTDGAHTHQSVVHADFFAVSDHDHGEHHSSPGVPGDTSSSPFSQISFPTLLPRSLVLSLPALQRVLISLPVTVLLLSLPFSFHTWILTRDHAPPLQIFAFSPLAPRSPPYLA